MRWLPRPAEEWSAWDVRPHKDGFDPTVAFTAAASAAASAPAAASAAPEPEASAHGPASASAAAGVEEGTGLRRHTDLLHDKNHTLRPKAVDF